MTTRNKGKAFYPVMISIRKITQPRGDSKGAVVVQVNGDTANVPRSHIHLHDPANPARCVIATDVDPDLMLRLLEAENVLAWTQQWVIDEKGLDAFPVPKAASKVKP